MTAAGGAVAAETPKAARRVPVDRLTALVDGIFRAAGCHADEAARIAHGLVGANLTGHDSHGVVRVPRYVEWLEGGRVFANRTPAVVTETDALAVVDGRLGFGQTVGPVAVDLGIAKAKRSGVTLVAVRNSGHLGRIGEWAERAAAAGLVSIHFVNVRGSLLVAPFGGTERRLSTAPVSIGVPKSDGPPIILDFATSYVAEGKVMVAFTGGKTLPPQALIEPDGTFSGNPETLYGRDADPHSPDARKGEGAIRAFGEHKGSGLAFMTELLAGALTGSGTAGPADGRGLCNGMLSTYIDPAVLGDLPWMEREIAAYTEFYKSARPDRDGGQVLTPGEPERLLRAERTAEGVPLPERVWEGLTKTAARLEADAGR